MAQVSVVDALTEHRMHDAERLVFEYIAMTEGENGRPVPRRVDDLPSVLSAECRALAAAYRAPGAMLLACVADLPVGCVGLKHLPSLGWLELKRRYVRAPARGVGSGRALMLAAHARAARTRSAVST